MENTALNEEPSTIYDDILCKGDLGVVIHNLRTKNKQLQLHVTSLEEDIQKLCDRINEMKQIQDNLSRNISELYKTAKSEIDRKDRLISELQSKIDDMVFKRNTASTNFGFKRQREEQTPLEVEMVKKVKCGNVKYSNDRENIKDDDDSKDQIPHNVFRDNKNKDIDRSRNYRVDFRGEQPLEVEIIKKVKCGNVKYSNDRENVKDDDCKDQIPRNVFRDNKNKDVDQSRNYRGDFRGEQPKQRNILREDKRHDRSLRFDKIERRSNSRDRRYRRDSRDSRDNHGRDRGDYNRHRRGNKDRDSRVCKLEDSREPQGRNERFQSRPACERDSKPDENEDISKNKHIKTEPRFSSAESTRSTPEPVIMDLGSTLNESKEEGEISETETKNKEKNNRLATRKKSIRDKERNKNDKNKDSTCHKGDQIQSFNVTKFITKQQETKKKELEIKTIEKDDKKLETHYKKEDIENKSENHSSENVRYNENTLGEIKGNQNIKSTKFESTNKEKGKPSKNSEGREDGIKMVKERKENENIQSSKPITLDEEKTPRSIATKNAKDDNEEDAVIKETKNQNITILSQILLNEGKVQPVISAQPTILQPKGLAEKSQKTELLNTQEFRENIKTIPQVNRNTREARVPRNLTEELDIKVEKPCHVEIDGGKKPHTNQAERVQRKISSLFDTPIKEQNVLTFNETFCLTQDGEIPRLHFENSETSSNQSIVDTKETSTPVTEFQIFKSNLPSLERSSSLSSVSIQFPANTSNILVKNIEPEREKATNSHMKDEHKIAAPSDSTVKHIDSTKQQRFRDMINSGHAVVENENLGYGNTSDMCNISLDLLHSHLGEYKAENYPNLTAHSEMSDISDLLLTPENNSRQKIQKKEESKTKLLNQEDMLEKSTEVMSNSKEQKLEASSIELIGSINNSYKPVDNTGVTSMAENTLLSPSNGKKRRKRCVIKWAE